MIKIIIILFIIVIILFVINNYNLFNFENFTTTISSSVNKINNNLSKIQNNFLNSNNNLKNNNNQIKQMDINNIDSKILFNNKDYNENLSIDNKDNQYFYTDMINQSNINETAFNIVYSIDPIDYSDVKTGLEKCNEECKGVCFENGYDGNATCFPLQTQTFDWGTLYKNPTFTYGYNAYGPNNPPN